VCRINQLQHDFGRLDSWCVFALTKFNAYSGNLLTRFARYFHFDEIQKLCEPPSTHFKKYCRFDGIRPLCEHSLSS
jgi:hypothetical protein